EEVKDAARPPLRRMLLSRAPGSRETRLTRPICGSFRKQPSAMPELWGEYRDQLAIALPHEEADLRQPVGGQRQRLHPDLIRSDERQRWDRHLRQHATEFIGGEEIDATAIERDCLAEWRRCRCTAGETGKPPSCLLHIGHRNEDAL